MATQYLQTTGRAESQAVMLGLSFRLFEQKASAPDTPASPVDATAP